MKQIYRQFTIAPVLLLLLLTDIYAQPYGWTSLSSGTNNNLYGVSFASAGTGTAVGLSGTILRTTNGGTNWVPQSSPGTSTHLFDVYFLNDNTGWIAGDVGKIIKTTNGGALWVMQNSSTPYQLQSLQFLNANSGFAAGWYGTVLKTTDGGTTWTVLNTGTSRNLNGVWFINASLGYAVGLVGKVIRTTNGGTSWDSIAIGTTYSLENVYFADSNNGNIVGENGTVYKTTNGGANWTSINLGAGSWLSDISATRQNLNMSTIIGQGGVVRKTSNGGTNWINQVSNTGYWLRKVSFSDTINGYAVGDNGTIIKTTTGGWLPPTAPGLVSPANNTTCQSITATLTWNNVAAPIATSQIEIATDNAFANLVVNIGHYANTTGSTTTYTIPAGILQYNTLYYWRIKDSNQVAPGPWTATWNFRTTFPTPVAPNLISPPNNSVEITMVPTLIWDSVANATTYRVRIAGDINFTIIQFDSAGITQKQVTVPSGKLINNKIYYWRVTASNTCVTSANSATWNFRTVQYLGLQQLGSEVPKEFKLFNNYPNPFNPSTSIKFDIPKAALVNITIYEADGKEIALLVNSRLDAGSYNYLWDASRFASGVYFYTITAGEFSSTRKMVLIK